MRNIARGNGMSVATDSKRACLATEPARRETSGKGELPKQTCSRPGKPIELPNKPWQFPQG